MAKQFIIAAMEETFGEYLLNMSTENLKIAALRGQIKLENVQLDGDLVGSHVLGAVGLSSFGVLSCYAKSVKVSIPWKNLEKEPTRFEVKGIHLVCVPLTPSTANQIYGSGSHIDPRCTLRTRAKRLALSRFERNFWNGQIPGEGPVMKRIQRAVKDVEKDMRRSGGSSSSSRHRNSSRRKAARGGNAEDVEVEDAIDKLVFNLGDSTHGSIGDRGSEHQQDNSSTTSATDRSFSVDDLPDLPRDWKVRLREKVMRNMVASVHGVHIRCEVPEQGLDLSGIYDREPSDVATEEKAVGDTAFALGFTLESLVVRTANHKWEVGSHDSRKKKDGSSMSSETEHLGPNEYVVHNNKIGYFNKLSIYWDDDPPLLLSETDALRGNYLKTTIDKLQSRITAAMEALETSQEPGAAVRQSLSVETPSDVDWDRQHQYICDSLDAEVRVRISDRTLPGPISCSADVLPLDFSFDVRPNQFIQYQRLQAAVKSQHRFDTMPRQRPLEGPLQNPRAWWKYAIACVTSRPNSRPWDDVKRISQCRNRYIELVAKKNAKPADGNGFHAGLSSKESAELLEMEELLPIEALLAFHLVALRKVHDCRQRSDVIRQSIGSDSVPDGSIAKSSRSKGSGRFRILRSSGRRKKSQTYSDLSEDESSSAMPESPSKPVPVDFDDRTAVSSMSLLDAMTLRLGKKTWFVDWKLHDATVNVLLNRRHDDRPLLHMIFRASGNARSFGLGKRDFCFDVTQFDVLNGVDKVLFISSVESDCFDEDDDFLEDDEIISAQNWQSSPLALRNHSLSSPDMSTPSSFLDLPPTGTVCRIAAGKNRDVFKLSVSAHPATLVWTTALLDGITELLVNRSSNSQTDLTQHIRNVATPLARKAQLTLLSPASFSLHLNVAAPKVWVPLTSDNAEGTLLLDAGTIKMVSSKDEGDTEASWNAEARSIGVSFVRGVNVSRLGNEAQIYLRSRGVPLAPTGRQETAVLRPFSIDACSRIVKDTISGRGVSFSGSVRIVEVAVSPVCLNLVDAEMLARSFGKWYARGVRRVQRRIVVGTRGRSVDPDLQHTDESVEQDQFPRTISLNVEKVEIALEGHSKPKKSSASSDERSLGSVDSLQECAPPTRTYLVEVFRISLDRTRVAHTERSHLSILDASIVRLRDASMYSPLTVRRDVNESENRILVRSTASPCEDTMPPSTEPQNQAASADSDDAYVGSPRSPVLSASLLHNVVAHLDEVEVDIDSVVLRVTPTTLKDCAKAFRRIAELAQLMTKEMERKVHEEGRKARRRVSFVSSMRDGDTSQVGSVATMMHRPVSPSESETMTEFTVPDKETPTSTPFDSSILFKVTVNQSTLLAGRPTSTSQKASPRSRTPSYAVIQVLSNALVMFQSIENPDATGTKTLHVSVDNVSALVNTEFERVPPSQAPPMIQPTSAEFRVVYDTENFGCVVAQDISLDCEVLKSCLTPNDISIMRNITRTMFERLRAFGSQQDAKKTGNGRNLLSSFIRYQKKGTGIATRIRAEIQSFSFVLLRAYKSYFGAPEFLDFNVREVKGLFEGCMSALSGDCSALVSVNSFSSDVGEWEYAVEPFPLNIEIEQMPNELVLNLAPARSLHLNCSGILLRDFAEMKFDIRRDRPEGDSSDNAVLTPSVLSTVGLRRATEARFVAIHNLLGLDIHVVSDSSDIDSEAGLVLSGTTTLLEGAFDHGDSHLILRLAETAIELVGAREPVCNLPLASSLDKGRLFVLKTASSSRIPPGHSELLHLLDGRVSPESMFSLGVEIDAFYYNAEPVVEWCMQNQRLRSSVVDLFSLPKGKDLLSSNVWSPEDDDNDADSFDFLQQFGQEATIETDGPEAAAGAMERRPATPKRTIASSSGRVLNKSNWQRPYLKNDVPEWTDMTCMLSVARERVMLPDSKWMWLNDWTVDLEGKLSEETDADGWAYASDFETFSKTKRYYERGDACRRRRWTRTRIRKPPKLNDPFCPLKFVWETSKDKNGCLSVTVRSHVRIKNATSSALTFFVHAPSWDEDMQVGTAQNGDRIDVPISLASAVYMRIARNAGAHENPTLIDCVYSDRFCIVPTGNTSSTFLRTSMDLKDVSGTILHFLVEVRSMDGIVDVIVEPVFRLVNILPCQLECHIGQVSRSPTVKARIPRTPRKRSPSNIAMTETLTIPSASSGACTAVDPWCKPHLSFRVPGYRWSAWQRIVNRKANTTWRPGEMEEELHFATKGDSEYADELQTLVLFDRLGKGGDPLVLIMSIECGHCPTIRVYSQYWIVDKTGFGCRFAEGFTDLLGSVPDPATSRRSHLLKEESKDAELRSDRSIPGHQWSIGSSGMSLYFSPREKLALAIETGIDRSSKGSKKIKSKWISPLDISNVIPKTVFSVDELHGPRRFELAIHVTLCPGLFARTKMISLLPRYQIVNLLHRELVIAQDGCLSAETIIPSQSAISFHWEKRSLPPKVRLGAPSSEERARGVYESCWTHGRFQIDRIGITSFRLPSTNTLAKVPMVVQAEVRLATKEQSSAVVVVIWSSNEKSNPLYMLRNSTRHTILCRQPLQDEDSEFTGPDGENACSGNDVNGCGTEIGPAIRSLLGFDRIEEFVWVLKPGDVACFGFDDPEKPHILEWTCVHGSNPHFDKHLKKAFLEVDAMGSTSILSLPSGEHVRCQIRAEYSTKVIEFVEQCENQIFEETRLDSLHQSALAFQERLKSGGQVQNSATDTADDDETVSFSVRLNIPAVAISVVDNVDPTMYGREILLARLDNIFLSFSQTREGYHEFEIRLMSFQVDNHVKRSIHPVLIFCPRYDEGEPLLHMSAVRRLQLHSNTFVFRYAAIRLLEVEIYLDRRTAETIATFIRPLMILREENKEEPPDWAAKLTVRMERNFARTDRRTMREIEKTIHMANSGRIYFEQLHLHPVRLGLTFTQEWIDLSADSETVMVFQFLRGMASIANAPLVFTSFVVGHVFEAPQALFRVIVTHYSSQFTKQVFGILGSLAILGAPADFITNVGTGVRDFFYEPIQGAVHGPRQFIEGLEAGTQSLARGLFVGVVRGAANVTEAVNSNLAGLTADDEFMDERKAHQRMLTDAMSRGATNRTFGDSFNLACASVARGLKSGALGIVEQPAIYASKHGPVGFLKGIGKAVVGAVVKPVVGLGDGAVLVMNHMSDATSKKQVFPKIPKRLRRALPSRSSDLRNCVRLEPYDERAAKAQKIVTGGESLDDVYVGHINISSHLIIASEQCFWAIDRRSREPWCVNWEEISHFGIMEGGVRIVVFSQTGLKTYVFQVESSEQASGIQKLLSMQLKKMANVSELNSALLNAESEILSREQIPGIRARQANHIFGSCNNTRKRSATSAPVNDEVDLVEQSFARVRKMESCSPTYFRTLDEEAWSLILSWGHLFSGLSSRRCIVASIINGTGNPIQIKSSKLIEGGSACYSLPTKEYDTEQGILHAGGVILYFGWGVVPNLLQSGSVFMRIESNGFVSDLSDQKSRATYATAMPGYKVGFLEKSYDDSGWWAKYWILVRRDS